MSFSGNFTRRLFFFLQKDIELRNNLPSIKINGDGGVTSFFVPNLGKYNSCEITRGGGRISFSSIDFFVFRGWVAFLKFIFFSHDILQKKGRNFLSVSKVPLVDFWTFCSSSSSSVSSMFFSCIVNNNLDII